MPPIRLLAGPPASAALWTELRRRLISLGHEVDAIELLDDAPTAVDPASLAARLVGRGAVRAGDVLVAHGLALPVAQAVAAALPLGALVLSNGPLPGLDPVAAALARWPEASLKTLMRPTLLNRWLASSAGLRRTVVNPYVMDRDTVVMLTAPWAGSAAGRKAAAAYLRSLPGAAPVAPRPGTPILLLWGDEDPLYPPFLADRFATSQAGIDRRTIPGGDHFHPLERPWAFADCLAEWLAVERVGAGSTP